MKKYPKVSVIIANYNGGQVLLNCINSLKTVDYPNFEIILVDDGSSDDPTTSIKYQVPNIKIIKNKENLGFVKANNEGLKTAAGKYILLLNNDTTVNKNLLKVMVEKMEMDKTIGVMQPKIKMMDNPGLLDNSGSYLTYTGFLMHRGYGAKDSKKFDQQEFIFSAKGACLMARKSIIDKVGLFDDDFVSYMEESDFCFRVWLLGYKVLYYPKTFINHKVGFSYSKKNVIEVNFNSFKNRILMLIKNLNTLNLILVLVPHILIVLGLGVFYLIKLQFSKASMIFRAIGWNIININKTLIKRSRIQKIRKVRDRVIFKYIMKKIDISEMFKHFLKVEANFR